MITITFAKAFRRHVQCPDETIELDAADVGFEAGVVLVTLGDVLAAYFDRHPQVRSYVLDDEGSFRRHITVFVDGEQVDHRRGATAVVGPDGTVHVFQALSGG